MLLFNKKLFSDNIITNKKYLYKHVCLYVCTYYVCISTNQYFVKSHVQICIHLSRCIFLCRWIKRIQTHLHIYVYIIEASQSPIYVRTYYSGPLSTLTFFTFQSFSISIRISSSVLCWSLSTTFLNFLKVISCIGLLKRTLSFPLKPEHNFNQSEI